MRTISTLIVTATTLLSVTVFCNTITANAAEPTDRVRAGEESDGTRIDVCIANKLHQRYPPPAEPENHKVPGKFTGGQCLFDGSIGGAGVETAATTFDFLRTSVHGTPVWGAPYIVRRVPPLRDGNANISWALEGAFEAGSAPLRAALTGQRSIAPLYSCRSSIHGGVHSGYVDEGSGGRLCRITYGGRTEAVSNYEVLYMSRSIAEGQRNEIIVQFTTGGDDLRGDNDNVHLFVLLRSGRELRFDNVNDRSGWGNNSTHTVSRGLPPTMRFENIVGVRLETTFGGGCCGDNWNLDALRVKARIGGAERPILTAGGSGLLFRFTGDQRVREFRP